jgi:Spy/CpxP family protein refolding chaperone
MNKSQLLVNALLLGSAVIAQGSFVCFADNKDVAKDADKAVTVASTSHTVSVGTTPFGRHLEPILKAVNANPQQRKQITELMEEFRPKVVPLKEKYKETQVQFLSAMETGRSPEEIMLKQVEMNGLYARIINEYCAMHLKVRKLLTPSQCVSYEKYRSSQGWLR